MLLSLRWKPVQYADGKLHPGPLGIEVVGDNSGVVTRGTADLTTVTGLLLEVTHDSSLGHVTDGHHVTNVEVSLLTAVHKLASVHTLGSNENLLLDLISVWIPEVSDSHLC